MLTLIENDRRVYRGLRLQYEGTVETILLYIVFQRFPFKLHVLNLNTPQDFFVLQNRF